MRVDIFIYSDFIPDGLLRRESIQGADGQHPSDVIQDAIDRLEEMKEIVS
jgi:hypothetical protein